MTTRFAVTWNAVGRNDAENCLGLLCNVLTTSRVVNWCAAIWRELSPSNGKRKEKHMAEKPIKLRTIDDLNGALEWLYTQQKEGKLDAKTADALNTTIKQASYLNGKLKLDYLKLMLTAKIKKIELPALLMLEA